MVLPVPAADGEGVTRRIGSLRTSPTDMPTTWFTYSAACTVVDDATHTSLSEAVVVLVLAARPSCKPSAH